MVLPIIHVRDDLGLVTRSGYKNRKREVGQKATLEGEKVVCNDQSDLVWDDAQLSRWWPCIGRWKFSFANALLKVPVGQSKVLSNR